MMVGQAIDVDAGELRLDRFQELREVQKGPLESLFEQ
jgi:hypothetical protein